MKSTLSTLLFIAVPLGSGACPSTGANVSPTETAPRVEAEAPPQGEWLTPAAIRPVVSAARPDVTRCYERALMANPGLAGRVTVRFAVAPDGAVTSASDGGSTLADAEVIACVLGVVQALTFPASEHGIEAINYPFDFYTTE